MNPQAEECTIYNVSCVSQVEINKLNAFYNESFQNGQNFKNNYLFKMLIHDALNSCAGTDAASYSTENRPVPYGGSEPYAFVSYSHEDYRRVWRLVKRLQEDGVRVWYDEGITPGTEWDVFIERKLEKSNYFICCITQNYWKSRNCLDELKYAVDLGDKEMLLLYLEEEPIPEGTGLRMRVGRIQNIHQANCDSEKAFMDKVFNAKGLDSILER